MQINYDVLTDTLYLSLDFNKKIDDSELDENFIILRKCNNIVYGLTIAGFNDRMIDNSWNDNFILRYFPDFDISQLNQFIKT